MVGWLAGALPYGAGAGWLAGWHYSCWLCLPARLPGCVCCCSPIPQRILTHPCCHVPALSSPSLQGRMIEHLRTTQAGGLEDLAVLVLDEADRLLEMGFAEEVHYIWVLQYGAFWACDG